MVNSNKERKINLNNKIKESLLNKGKVHELEVENLKVEMIYSKNQKEIEECMLNILKQKVEK